VIIGDVPAPIEVHALPAGGSNTEQSEKRRLGFHKSLHGGERDEIRIHAHSLNAGRSFA
jgi:hypothetical protein